MAVAIVLPLEKQHRHGVKYGLPEMVFRGFESADRDWLVAQNRQLYGRDEGGMTVLAIW